ncbi:hypothetical protein BXU01_14485 [[Flexibacter] sp. ATCC 35103]|nr:hypothetical protein BXU01_14485 [[Flexibacter] sp. ATCC 35103]
MTIGGKKAPEAFSVLELLSKGGLRLPQMTTTERNAFAVSGNVLANGLTIFNKTTSCVEYWNGSRWVSLCEGTSQITISPAVCLNVAADGTGCDQTFSIDDVDCPNGPFTFSIVAGNEYGSLYDIDLANGKFNIGFNENTSVNTRSILVRVTSTCNNSYKDFLFSQKGVECSSYAVPTISPSAANLTLCVGGGVYLSVPFNTSNLDKVIWTRNGIEVARGVSYYVATQKGKYNVSMGAIGCNTNTANERNITESSTTAAAAITIITTNNGIICGTNSVKLTALGTTSNVLWFHNGVQEKSGAAITLDATGDVGEWFAVINEGNCFSKASNIVTVSKSTSADQIILNPNNVLVNGQPLTSFNAFCQGGSLDLTVANKTDGITYTWYNGNDIIRVNPFIIPASQTKISLRMVATDNSGALCPAEVSVLEKDILTGNAPGQPNITGNAILCDGTTDLTLVPQTAGTYTYTWYKDNVKMSETTATIRVSTPGAVYNGTVTNATGCTSTMAVKAISANVSSLPVLSWQSRPDTATFGATVTLQTAIEFGPAISYTWTADNGAVIIGSGASVSVRLPASGSEGLRVNIKVTAENNCGRSTSLEHFITMGNACPTPVLTAQSDITQSVAAGSSVQVSISVSGGVSPAYQWYSSGTSGTTGNAISGANNSSYSYSPSTAGTSYLYCIVTNGCSGNLQATSPVFTVVTQANPATLPAGSGTFGGKSCFDIAESNDGGTCGTLSARGGGRANFNLAATNTQTYTFTPSGTVSKVRFSYVESLGGSIVRSITNNGNETSLNVSGPVTATVVYKNTLSSGSGRQGDAYGRSATNALSVDLYVIYNNNANGTGTDVQVKLTAKIQDCSCCGAYISPNVWREFMCYNLGADESLDPTKPALGLVGDYYQWGNKTPAASYRNLGSVANWDRNYVKMYLAWGGYWTKPVVDPCPEGYRIPGSWEWDGISKNNTVTSVGNVSNGIGNSGYLIGSSLMLPNGGHRSITNGYADFMFKSFYWSRVSDQGSSGAAVSFRDASSIGNSSMATGGNIRCISEY